MSVAPLNDLVFNNPTGSLDGGGRAASTRHIRAVSFLRVFATVQILASVWSTGSDARSARRRCAELAFDLCDLQQALVSDGQERVLDDVAALSLDDGTATLDLGFRLDPAAPDDRVAGQCPGSSSVITPCRMRSAASSVNFAGLCWRFSRPIFAGSGSHRHVWMTTGENRLLKYAGEIGCRCNSTVRHTQCAGRPKPAALVARLTGDRGFESRSLHQRVRCEP
jgi:hypothetical protein